MMIFRDDQLKRYSRHILLPEVGAMGQKKLLEARVLIIGAGGLGCPVGYYLAAAGVGSLGIVDDDIVEMSNLQRQIAHNSDSIGMPKVYSAKKTFETLNPDIRVTAYRERITKSSIAELMESYDIIVDGTDNFPTRYLINDTCVKLKKPLVSGAILRFEGQVTTVLPGKGHCYRCLFEDMPPQGFTPSCSEAGVIGAIPGVIGSLQAIEVMKLILGKGKVLSNKLLIYDALNAEFRRVKVPRNSDCPACGENALIEELQDYGAELCGVRA